MGAWSATSCRISSLNTSDPHTPASGHQLLVKGVHGEGAFEPAAQAALGGHLVRVQINLDLHAAAVPSQGEEPVNVRFGQLDRENAAVEHVLAEDADKAALFFSPLFCQQAQSTIGHSVFAP